MFWSNKKELINIKKFSIYIIITFAFKNPLPVEFWWKVEDVFSELRGLLWVFICMCSDMVLVEAVRVNVRAELTASQL